MSGFSSIIIGNESLTQHCAAQLLERGHRIEALVTEHPDILRWANDQNIPVTAPGPGLAGRLQGHGCDWLLSIANLRILTQDVLALARKGAVNFHDGPLPRHAGLNAPVWAMLEGETEHGITWHLIDGGVDEGDILVQRMVDIHPHDTALTLNTKCYEAGLESFGAVMDELESGLPNRRPQDLSRRSVHSGSDRPPANGIVDFRDTAERIERQVRALDHRPYWNPLCTAKILARSGWVSVSAAGTTASRAAPGTVLEVSDDSVTVACADGAVRLTDFLGEDGQPAAANALFETGETLPLLTAQLRDAIDRNLRGLARMDGVWRARLAGLHPVELPFLGQAKGELVEQVLSLSPDRFLPALALLVGRLSAGGPADIACSDAALQERAKTGFVCPWIPEGSHRLADALDGDITGFAADLFSRDPALAGLAVPPIGLCRNGGHIPGTAITLITKPDGVSASIDTGRIPLDFARVLLARLDWIATRLSEGTAAEDPSFLPEEERQAVTKKWVGEARAVPDDFTLPVAFERQVQKTPDATAVCFEGRSVSYRALDEKANRLAHVLLDMGVGPGRIVGVHCHRGPELVAAALAVLKAGGAYLPLDPEYPAQRLQHYLSDSGAEVILSQSALRGELPQTAAAIVEVDRDPRIATAAAVTPPPRAKATDLAYMIYTSGSTGRPKGVMVEHRNLSNFLVAMDAVVPAAEDATWLSVTSLSFDISVLELFYTLSRGFKVVIPGAGARGAISGPGRRRKASGMAFSLYYWGNDDGAGRDKYRLLLEGSRFADENGFCAVWTPERHFHAFGGPYPNPSVTGAAVAAVTRRIGVRAGSCVAPLHHPARIAEEWAVIDNLTNGRAGLAVASGWQPDDFVLRPENAPPDNKPAMLDSIGKLRRLWRGEPVAFQRKDGSPHEVVTQPRPVSEELPIWVTTAGNPETWREAGRIGANVLTHLLGQSIEEVREKIGLYHQALRDAGHDPARFDVTLMLHTCLAETREAAREIAREPMKDYLRSAAGLIKQYAWAFPAFKKPKGVKTPFELDLGTLSEDELEGILDFAFERYFNEAGLFGTVEDALARSDQLMEIGVTEIACLIDYGIPTDQVLEGLKPLAQVVRVAASEMTHEEDDYSIAAEMNRQGVTHLQCTPSLARMLLADDAARDGLKRVKHLFLGGEALSASLVKQLREVTDASITNMYGPTETTIWSATERVSEVKGTVCLGRPIANTQLYVLDRDMRPLGIGEAGELWIGGAGVARGYWKRDDLTTDRFRENPFGAGRIYGTGDLVRRRTDGRLDFLGRIDHQVKLRGFRIELGEIETALVDIPGIETAVVIAREDIPGDTRLAAYYLGQNMPPAKLREMLSARLPDYMLPAHFMHMSELPLTPNKKVDRAALPAPGAQMAEKPAPAPSPGSRRSDGASEVLRERVAAIWSEVLGISEILARDNFFELGGHSLLAVQTHRAIRERLQVPGLSITDIFQYPTLSAICDRISSLLPVDGPDMERPPADSASPLAPAAADRAKMRSEAMARRRAMRARRSA